MQLRDLRLLIPIVTGLYLLRCLFTGVIHSNTRYGALIRVYRDEKPSRFWGHFWLGWLAVAFEVWFFWPRH